MEQPIKWLLPIIFVAFPIFLYWMWINQLKKRAADLCGHYVYTLPQIPIIGNSASLAMVKGTTEIWEFITDQCDKHKEGVLFWVFHLPWIFIQDIEVIETILTSPVSIEKSYVYRLLETITDGVFNAKGEKWRKLRKKLNLTFSQRQIDLCYDDINEQSALCVDVLKKYTDKYINIQTFMTTYFFDTVCRTHFGVHTKEQTERRHYVTETAARIIELTMAKRFFNLFFHPLCLFKLSKVYKYIEQSRRSPLDYIQYVVSERFKDMEIQIDKGIYDERKKIIYVDLVRDYLNEVGTEPTLHMMEQNTSDLIVAASDTTSVAVSSAFYYMACYPEIQEKVYRETLTVFGESTEKYMTKEDINNLVYLEMVVKETLRHTSPPGVVRELAQDLDVGKYIIPKGTNAYVVIKSVHRNPEYYERPSEFYPEHFLPEKNSARPKYAFLPFSAGPRNCPGLAYSYVTMKAVIACVVRNFKIETNIPQEDIKFKMVLMQEHINGYSIKLTKR